MARHLAYLLAHQSERDLSGEEFVIGQTPTGRGVGVYVLFVLRLMQVAEGICDIRKILFLRQWRIGPFREGWQALDGAFDDLAQCLRRQAGGQRIDRLDQSQVLRFGDFYHEIRMDHRGPAVEPVDLAADHDLLIYRQ
ncbi:hypothetical protein D3C87_1772450 [compost metagenome]